MRTCGTCGAALPAGLPAIMCPRCRLGGALAGDRDALPEGGYVIGSYRVIEELGRGGMGVVYRARPLDGVGDVALKTIAAGALATPEVLRRFQHEAAALAEVQHPNLVAIREAGEHEGTPFLVMTLVEGRTLAARLAEGPMPPRESAELVRTIAEAVSCIHARGILHRDLKPSNVLLDAEGRPYVSDFGLAKLAPAATVSELTRSGQLLGSPAYMPPEQARGDGKHIGPEADVYSLGAILYHLLTGRAPFEAASLHELLEKVETSDPVAPRRLRADIPRDLETICLGCLEKSPLARCRTAQELADDLGRWLSGEPIHARRPPLLRRPLRWCRRRPVVASLAALALALAVVTGVQIARTRRQTREVELTQRQSALDEARALARSHDAGRRSRGLAAVTRAAAGGWNDELRDAAISLLTSRSFELIEPPLALPPDIRALAFSSSLNAAAYSLEGKIHVIRTESGADAAIIDEVATRTPGDGEPAMIEFSSTGRLLAVQSANGLLRIYDYGGNVFTVAKQTGQMPEAKLVRRWQTHASAANGFHSVLPRGDKVVALRLPPGSEHPAGALVLASLNREPDKVIRDSAQPRDFFVVNPLKETCAVFRDGAQHMQTLATGETINVLPAPSAVTRAMWQSNGQRILTGTANGGVGLCSGFSDFKTPIDTLRHSAAITRLGMFADGLAFLSVSEDGLTRVSAEHQAYLESTELTGHALSRDGTRLATTDRAGRVRFLRQELPLGVQTFGGTVVGAFESWEIDVAAKSDVLLMDSGVWLHARPGAPNSSKTASTGWRRRWRGAAFTPDETGVVTMNDKGFVLLDARAFAQSPARSEDSDDTATLAPNIPAPDGPPRTAIPIDPAWMPRRFCLGKDGTIAIENTAGRCGVAHWPDVKSVRELAGPRVSSAPGPGGNSGSAGALAVSPDGAWVAAGFPESGGAAVWDARRGVVVKELPQTGVVHFSPCGRWLLLGSDDTWRLYAAGTWQEKWTLPRKVTGKLRGVAAFSPDGNALVLDVAPFALAVVETGGARTLVNLPFPEPRAAASVRFTPGLIYAGTRANAVFRWNLAELREALRKLGAAPEF